MKKPLVFFTVADEANLHYAKMMENSLKKFYPDAPLVVIGPERLDTILISDKFYLMTPLIAKDLIKEYELVIKIDADSVICGSLDHIINDDFDVGCVRNSSPKTLQVGIWDISPPEYMNCGFVAMRSERFINHWWQLCQTKHFRKYRFREQDLLNILYQYGNYKTRCFDDLNKFHGLASNGYWVKCEMRGDDIVLPKGEKYPDEDKTIKIIHWAGGNTPNKMNFHLHFKPSVIKRLEYLTKEENGKTKSSS